MPINNECNDKESNDDSCSSMMCGCSWRQECEPEALGGAT